MIVTLKDGDISSIPEEELSAYKKYVHEKYPDEVIDELILSFDDEGYVNMEIHKHSVPFTRIRRITGYLSNIKKMNNAKRVEVHDRVKHSENE